MGVHVAAEQLQPFRAARGTGSIVFDPARLRQAGPDWLEPAHWGTRATPVAGAGGRGAAWFVSGEFGEGVLRHYRRGGLAARLGRRRYLWLGESRVRSLAEFRLLAALRREQVPVPAPLLAGYWRQGLSYRAAILVERIPGARPLADWLSPGTPGDPWAAAGGAIARMHRAGVDHADLNAHNLLLDGQGHAWLIDFDRARRRAPGPWREANLARLARSLAKLAPAGDARWREGFARLCAAHAAALEAAP